jgi:hypothetical protein
MNYIKERKQFVEWTKEQLIGFDLKDGILNQRPLDRFHTGFLFPGSGFEENEYNDSDDENLDDENSNNTVKDKSVKKEKRRYLPPSSAGFSFYIKGEDIELRVFYNACNYTAHEKKEYGRIKSWTKNKLTSDGKEILFSIKKGILDHQNQNIIDNKGKIQLECRKHQSGFIVTVSISNTQSLNNEDDATKRTEDKNLKTLFEVKLKCFIEKGKICKYPMQDKELLSKEEREVDLRYKDVNINAVGHGVAVDWDENENPKRICTEFMPIVEVPHIESKMDDSEILQFDFLQNKENKEQIVEGLIDFVTKYENWILKEQMDIAEKEDDEDKEIANEMINRQKSAKDRMQK